MAGPLAQIFSASDSFKRTLIDALRNPQAKLEQIVGHANDRAGNLNEMTSAAAQEGLGLGPASERLANVLADSYNMGGIFIGPNSKLWNGANELRAADMASKSGDVRGIWDKTGTFKNPDGLWRQEIDDSASKFVEASGIEAKAAALRNRSTELKQTIKNSKGQPDLFPKELTAARRPLRQEVKRNERELDRYYGPTTRPESGNLAPYAYEHENLYKSYPSLEKVVVRQGLDSPEYYGSFRGSASKGTGQLDVSNRGLKSDPRSTATHEMQHAVQGLEGFAMGGNPTTARLQMQRSLNADMQPYRTGNASWEGALGDLGKANTALYAEKLRTLSTKTNITPRQITGMDAWYQHSNAVRDQLGAMPKRSGTEQKRWLRDAAQVLYNKEFNAGRFKDVENLGRAQWESLRNKANRKMNKFQQDARQHSEVSSKFKRLDDMNDFELYERLGGEAESRAVQKRLDYTPEQRKSTFPLDDYDVPLTDLIFYK